MALMERVATLLRANVNDLIDRAEDPEKMLKQLERDLENQLLQLKTQLAIAIADQHILRGKAKDEADCEQQWKQKAQLALTRGKDDMARTALERSISHAQMAADLNQQLTEQTEEVEAMRTSYNKLDAKLKDAQHQMVLLTAQLRRAKVAGKAITTRQSADTTARALNSGPSLTKLKARITGANATNAAARELMDGQPLEAEWLDENFQSLEREEKVDRLLAELKAKQGMLEAG